MKFKDFLMSFSNFVLLFVGILLIGLVKSECKNPSSFGSFNGKPASNINDCFWDFVACKRENSIGSSTIFRKGRMINRRNQNGRDQSCCQNRYHKCCEHVTGWTDQKDPTPTVPTTPRPTPTRPVTPRSICPKTTPSNLIGCIWEFNCCVQEKSDLGLPENVCYKTFNRCKMVVMGMMPMDDEEENNGSGGGGENDEEYHTDELPSLIKPSVGPQVGQSGTSPGQTTISSNTEKPGRKRSPLTNCIKENSRCIKNQQRRMSMPGCSRLYSQCVEKATSSTRNRTKYKP